MKFICPLKHDIWKEKWCWDCKFQKEKICDYPHEIMEKQNDRPDKDGEIIA